MVTLDRIRLTGLLRKSLASAGLFYFSMDAAMAAITYGEDSYRRIFRSNEPDGAGAAPERAARVSA